MAPRGAGTAAAAAPEWIKMQGNVLLHAGLPDLLSPEETPYRRFL
jgi:hypothetical protein